MGSSVITWAVSSLHSSALNAFMGSWVGFLMYQIDLNPLSPTLLQVNFLHIYQANRFCKGVELAQDGLVYQRGFNVCFHKSSPSPPSLPTACSLLPPPSTVHCSLRPVCRQTAPNTQLRMHTANCTNWRHCISHFTIQTLHCTLHTAHYTLHTAHFTLHTAHCTLHTAHCKLHTAHCTLHSAHCSLYTT